jgi:hypothetical protein
VRALLRKESPLELHAVRVVDDAVENGVWLAANHVLKNASAMATYDERESFRPSRTDILWDYQLSGANHVRVSGR